MSLDAYHRSLISTNLNLKTFVSESSESRTIQKFNDKRQLNFHGDEARAAYEEIVAASDAFVLRTKNQRVRDEKRQKSNSKQEKCRPCKRPGESRNVTKVTANSVLKAVESGDIQYLERNLTLSNVNISDDYGWTPLMSAAFCGNYKIVDFLLKLGANIHCRDKSGFTAGGLASKKNHSGIVALLKEKRSPDPKAVSSKISGLKRKAERSTEQKKFYCSVCQETFRDTSVGKHETSTLHIFNLKPKLPGAVYSIPKRNKGYQIMLKGGWNEEGLGPDGRGSKYPVKTVLKRDRKGLDETRRHRPRITHYQAGDFRAISSVKRQPREKTQRKRDREKFLSEEAKRERALRRALS